MDGNHYADTVQEEPLPYEIYNSSVDRVKKNGQSFCVAQVSCRRKNRLDGSLEQYDLYRNSCRVGYEE